LESLGDATWRKGVWEPKVHKLKRRKKNTRKGGGQANGGERCEQRKKTNNLKQNQGSPPLVHGWCLGRPGVWKGEKRKTEHRNTQGRYKTRIGIKMEQSGGAEKKKNGGKDQKGGRGECGAKKGEKKKKQEGRGKEKTKSKKTKHKTIVKKNRPTRWKTFSSKGKTRRGGRRENKPEMGALRQSQGENDKARNDGTKLLKTDKNCGTKKNQRKGDRSG